MGLSIGLSLWLIATVILLFPDIFKTLYRAKVNIDLSNVMMLMLILTPMLGALYLGGGSTGLKTVINQLLYFGFPFIAGKYIVKDVKDFNKIISTLALASFIICTMTLFEFISKQSIFSYLSFLMIDPSAKWENSQFMGYRGELIRPIASFGQGIYLGLFLGLIIIIAITILFRKGTVVSIRNRSIIILLLSLTSFSLMLSQSRTAIVSLIIIIVIFIFINIKRLKVLNIMFLLATIFFSLFVFKNIIYHIVDELLFRNITSTSAWLNFISRLDIFETGWQILYSDVSFWGALTPNVIWYRENVDLLNGFLWKYMFHGYFYGTINLLFWFLTIWRSLKIGKTNQYGYMLFLIMIYFFISNNITTIYFQNELLFYLIAGIIFNPVHILRKGEVVRFR